MSEPAAASARAPDFTSPAQGHIPESRAAAAALIPWYEAQLRAARERARGTARVAERLHGELSVLRDVARGEFEPDDRPYWPVFAAIAKTEGRADS